MDNQNKLSKSIDEVQNKLAEGISTLIRDINKKKEIVIFLKNMKNQPSEDVLKRVNIIAIQKEDYETCEALKEYAEYRNIII